MEPLERKELMKKLRAEGLTLQKIGDKFGVTRERVRQILAGKQHQRKVQWVIAHQSFRRTCYICRAVLETPTKFCDNCVKENKLGNGGRELPRGLVRGRDNNTCQVCGYKWKGTEKKRLDVHHLNGLCGKHTTKYDPPEMLYFMITVCHKCHYNLHDHRQYGAKKIPS